MPAYGNPGPDEDMYGDAQTTEPAGPEEELDEGEQTTLVPKSICPGMKVGDELILKIVAEHDKDWEVAYAKPHSEEEESEDEAPPPGAGQGAMMGMGEMME